MLLCVSLLQAGLFDKVIAQNQALVDAGPIPGIESACIYGMQALHMFFAAFQPSCNAHKQFVAVLRVQGVTCAPASASLHQFGGHYETLQQVVTSSTQQQPPHQHVLAHSIGALPCLVGFDPAAVVAAERVCAGVVMSCRHCHPHSHDTGVQRRAQGPPSHEAARQHYQGPW